MQFVGYDRALVAELRQLHGVSDERSHVLSILDGKPQLRSR